MGNPVPLRSRLLTIAVLVVSTWLFVIGFALTLCRALGLVGS